MRTTHACKARVACATVPSIEPFRTNIASKAAQLKYFLLTSRHRVKLGFGPSQDCYVRTERS